MYKIWKNLGVGENAKKLGKKAAAELKYRKPFEAGKKRSKYCFMRKIRKDGRSQKPDFTEKVNLSLSLKQVIFGHPFGNAEERLEGSTHVHRCIVSLA